MTCLRNISRFVVVSLALAVAAAAAVPAGWIALRYEPPAAGEEKGHWILIKAPEDGLTDWWSDAELAKIAAGDPDHVKRIETGWNPVDHPAAEADEAELLAEELAKYWGGDLPQANFWAHGAMIRRGQQLQAFHWEQDGAGQRSALEQSGQRPSIPAAAVDPAAVDPRYGNSTDVVSYGDRWGSHLLAGTLDHVSTSERNKAERRHHPNPPPAGEVEQKARDTVEACREASLKAEMGVFSNYVRGWGGLGAKAVSFPLPANCVTDPGPLAVVTPTPPPPVTPPPAPKPVTPPKPPKPKPVTPLPSPKPPKPKPVTPPTPSPKPPKPNPKPPAAPSKPVTPPSDPTPPSKPITPPPSPSPPPPKPPEPHTACDGSKHATQEAADAVKCTYTACDGSEHDTQAEADAVSCKPDKPRFPDCDGKLHDTKAEADAVSCDTPTVAPPDDPLYTACDGTLHHSQEEADAIQCRGEETDELCEQDPFAAGCDQF